MTLGLSTPTPDTLPDLSPRWLSPPTAALRSADQATALSARPAGPTAALLAAVLDELDYPILVVDSDLVLVVLNRCGRRLLDEAAVLTLSGDRLRAVHGVRQSSLVAAVQSAAKGQRSLLPYGTLAEMDNCADAIAVVPAQSLDLEDGMVLLTLSRPQPCTHLSLAFFARMHGITPAECAVLQGLCAGATPLQIALDTHVALSTVRTHVAHLRGKTRTRTISQLVGLMTRLPPIMSRLA